MTARPFLRPALLAALLVVPLAVPHPAFAEDTPPSKPLNPDPAPCCECIAIKICGLAKCNDPDKPLVYASKETNADYTIKLSVGAIGAHGEIVPLDTVERCANVRITSIRIIPVAMEPGGQAYVKYVYPASAGATAPPIKVFPEAGYQTGLSVTIPGGEAARAKAKNNLWKVVVECAGALDPTSGATVLDCEHRFSLGEGGCRPCESTSKPKASNGCFTYDIPLGSSNAGETTGTLRFFTPGMSNPGIAGVGALIPSSYATTYTGDLITRIETGNTTVELVSAPTAGDANAFTITHKHTGATQAETDAALPFRTTTIALVPVGTTVCLRADSSLHEDNGEAVLATVLSTFRYQQSLSQTVVGGLEVDTYTLDSGPVDANGAFTILRTEVLTITHNTDGTRTHRETVLEDGSVTVSDIKTVWENFPWGWEKIREVVDPDGANLTSTWSYYDPGENTGVPDSIEGTTTEGYGRLKEYVRYDGYVETHYYWIDNDVTILPFAGNSHGLTVSRGFGSGVLTTTRKVGTNIISKETESIDGDTTTTTTYATDGTAPITLVTTVTQMPYNAPFGGQPASISHPDGTLTTFTYTPVSGGGKSVTGTTGVRPGSTFTLGKSTTSTYNRYGVVTGEAVSDIASAVLLSSRASLDTDLYGRVTKWAYFNDPDDYSETIYGCCGLEYERARDGTVTNYFRDARERINTSTVTLGIAATGFVPRTTITGYTYGANDGLPEETVSVSVNGTAAGATTTVRDLVGRTVSVTSPGPDGAAETTRYAYPGNGLTTTMTNADGGTVVTESHPDGQTKSVSDNAAIRMDYAYDSHDEGGGGLVTSVTTAQGVSGVHTTYTNLAGRVFKVVATAPHGGSATTFTTYNAKGQAEVVTSSGQPAVKYIYDDLGDRVATWTDRNSDEEFNNTADEETGIRDSWTGGITDYLPADNAPSGLGDCRRTRAWVRLDTNPGTDVPVSTTYQSIDGLRSLSESIGVDGATTTGSNRPLNGAWTSTTTYPDLTSTISATTLLTGGVQQTVTTRYTSEQQPATVEATTILTDPLGRTASTTSGRGHVTNYIYHPNGGQLDTVTQINAGPDESDLVTSYAYALTPLTGDQGAETATRTLTTTLPDATSQYRTTNILGQTLCQWGSQTTPVAFAYDAAGRRHTQTTYRAAVGASADTFPTITGDTTTWNHDPSGVLLEKIYPGGKKTAYTYYVSGRLHTRTWERPISATDATKVEAQYAYFTSGQLSTVTYNDGTANLAHTQDRLGRTTTIIQENQSELAYSYADGTGGDLGIDTETITYTLPGRAPFTRVLDRFDRSLGRDTGWDLKQPGTGGLVENTAIHTYSDTTGRLDTILGASAGTFTYGYVSGSDLIDTVTKAGSGGAPDLRPTRTYETNRDVLASVSNDVRTPNGNGFDTVTRSAYDYTTVNGGTNKLGQRGGVAATFNLNGTPASANSSWGHDSLGQVTSAANSGDTTFNRAYQFDTIGNRVEARDGVTSTTGTPNYSSDARNQYLSVPFVPAGPSYDDDGNMTSGPLKVGADILPAALVWDAENRPIQITLTSTTTKTVINRFDPLGRLISRTEGTDPETDPTTIYLYDGWNRIAEYTVTTDTANPPVTSYTLARTYLWGLDLSGALQGAGGVGGLLAVRIHTGGTGVEGFYYPTYDGNGNISEYLKPDGTVAAHFEYDPFGNTVVPSEASTGLAANFAYRFSTKPLDLTTGLYYYGYRWLDPLTGRWPSRDPIGERGGVNLYGFVANDGVSKFDILGKTESISEMKEGPCCCKVGGVLTTKVSAEQIGKCIKVKAVIFKTYFHLSWNPLKGFGTYYTYQKDVVAPGDLPSEHGRNDHSLSIAIDYSWSADGDCPCVSKIASDECTSVPIMAEHKYTFSDGSTASSTPHANLGYEKFFILTRSHGYRLVNNFDEGGIVSFPITRFEVNNTSGAAKLDVSVEAESKQIYHGIFTFKEGSNIPEDE